MQAVVCVEGRVEVRERPDPAPGSGEVLVRVAGAGLNRADLMQAAGFYPPPAGVPVDIPGLEFAGSIDAIGLGVDDLNVGDRVFGIVGGGGQAEYLTTAAAHCAPVPDGLDLVAMGAVPEAFITAYDALVTQAKVRVGEWVLIHAVGSGVGTAGLQLAKALGCHVVGTARSADKLERCRALGLDRGIVAPTKPGETGQAANQLDVDALARQIIEVTGGGADVVLDLVGGGYVEAEVAAAAPRARIVFVGTLAGGSAQLNVLGAMQKRLTMFGTVLRTRDAGEKAAITTAFARDVVPLLESHAIMPIVERVFDIDDAPAAYALLGSDATFGKLVLSC